MKKLFIVLAFSFILAPCFCEVFPNSETLVEKFFDDGDYIKVIEDSNNIHYLRKDNIACIKIDEDDLEIILPMGYNAWYGKNNDALRYTTKRWSFSSDDNGNILITRK